MIAFATQPLDQLTAFHTLRQHYAGSRQLHLRRMFSIDPMRSRRMSLHVGPILLDYSKNRITDQTIKLLTELADEAQLGDWISALFSGQYDHDNKPVTHTALRNIDGKPVAVDGTDLMPGIEKQLNRLSELTDQLQQGSYITASGQQIRNVAFIDANGIPTGSKLIYRALEDQSPPTALALHNFDCANRLGKQLDQLDPSITLIVLNIASFGERRGKAILAQVRQWLSTACDNVADQQQQIIVIASNSEAAQHHELSDQQLFILPGHIGSRYTLWSAAALSLILRIGTQNYRELLIGARAMDNHFSSAPFNQNMPVTLALLGIWYHNFFGAESHVILPYDQQLALFPDYLAEADMHSNAKSIDRQGNRVSYPTGPVLWGSSGSAGHFIQHQLLHQSRKLIPADFLVAMQSEHHDASLQNLIVSQALAQAEALMRGRTFDEALKCLRSRTPAGQQPRRVEISRRVLRGNNPSNMLLIDRITAQSLGSLIALYEHKAFVQSVIWNLNSFENTGEHLAKKLCDQVLQDINTPIATTRHDGSTNTLIDYYRNSLCV